MRKYTHTHTHTHTQRAPGADPIFSWRYVHVQIKRTGTTSKQTEFQPQRPEILRNRHHIVQVNPHSLVAHITKVSEPESPPPQKKNTLSPPQGGSHPCLFKTCWLSKKNKDPPPTNLPLIWTSSRAVISEPLACRSERRQTQLQHPQGDQVRGASGPSWILPLHSCRSTPPSPTPLLSGSPAGPLSGNQWRADVNVCRRSPDTNTFRGGMRYEEPPPHWILPLHTWE